MTDVPPQRVSPIRPPEEYTLPSRPDGAPDTVLDAYRQTHFLLGGDLKLFAEAMNLQLRLLKDAYPSRYRTHALAALTGLWSRAYLCLGDAVLLTGRGSYPSALPLIRTTCEFIAAEKALRLSDAEEHDAWLRSTLRPDERHKAFEFDLGRFFSGEQLARDPILGSVYRAASDLARPNFGATLLQVGPESNNVRLAVSFGDTAFHLGWAEVILGWALALAARQARLIIAAEPVFPVSDEVRAAHGELQRRVDEALGRDDRCRIEEVEDDGSRRYLVHSFRRAASAAPKRIIL